MAHRTNLKSIVPKLKSIQIILSVACLNVQGGSHVERSADGVNSVRQRFCDCCIFCLHQSFISLQQSGEIFAFILGVQHVGTRHLTPEFSDIEYEKIFE